MTTFLILLTGITASGFISALYVLIRHETLWSRLGWPLPWGSFYVGVDGLSALFLLVTTIVCFLAGLYGVGYFKDHGNRNDLKHHFFLYLLLVISFILILCARNAVLFLMAWEAMSLSSYFLITHDDYKEEVRAAGLLYFIATHLGTFCLMAMFILLGSQAGSMDFDQMSTSHFPLALAGVIFVLALMGFGTKAGFIPLHIWLPHAHPAAPSHISAVLSGIMIKMGIYGIMRIILLVGHFPPWCSIVLLAIGITSGVGGVLYALGQHEIKRLLAYHSIENIGIIALGLGVGLWGQINGNQTVAVIGYAGGLLHVFNHAIFKALLFLSAGSVIRRTHTGEIDHLGGLLKFFPWTGSLFLVGSLAICGLPLFNGFISEWLVFQALFRGVFSSHMEGLVFLAAAIITLALIGALALMCFTKAFGVIFLGHPRFSSEPLSEPLSENTRLMIVPMVILAGICVWIGLFPRTMVSICLKILNYPVDTNGILQPLQGMVFSFMMVVVIAVGLIALKKLFMRIPIEKSQTWGCGYAKANSRMQYTASSFANPILRLFRDVLCFHSSGPSPERIFPQPARLTTHVTDASENFFWRSMYQFIVTVVQRLKVIQCGFAQMYVLYIFLFLFFILIWKTA